MKNIILKTVLPAGLFLVLLVFLPACQQENSETPAFNKLPLEDVAEQEKQEASSEDNEKALPADGASRDSDKAGAEKQAEPENRKADAEKQAEPENRKADAEKQPPQIMIGQEGSIDDLLPGFQKVRSYPDTQQHYKVIPRTDLLITIEQNMVGTEILRITPFDTRTVILIKGDTFVRMRQATQELYVISGAEYGSSLPDFDYIGYWHPMDDTVTIVPNPLSRGH